MTWKTYTAVSGATVLAGWLASAPPSNTPAPAATSRRSPAATAPNAGNDIEEQAARLQARMRQEPVYREPARNPFRFAEREVPRPAPSAAQPGTLEPTALEPAAPALPPPPPVKLSGIAEDRSGDRLERTAILSSQAGVLLVREGDAVLGQYRVARIDANAVELTDTLGGPPVRLTIRP
ncbi:MAG: hypothetical protein FJW14_14145 [Acidimicrobiia bacterium]|nr:hypothetical protein [Acidimicrobiia bacterium]